MAASSLDTFAGILQSRTRAQIRSRPLAVVRSSLVGDSGEIVAQEILGLLIAADRRPQRGIKSDIQTLIDAIESLLVRAPDTAGASWAETAAAVHATFWSRRIEREQLICRAITAQRHSPRQPGLFWKHESEVTDGTPTDSSPAGTAAASIQSAERSRLVTLLPAVVALLLVP